MINAKCNICGEEWELLTETGYNLRDRLRITGYYDFPIGASRADANICSLECVIVWAREKQREVIERGLRP